MVRQSLALLTGSAVTLTGSGVVSAWGPGEGGDRAGGAGDPAVGARLDQGGRTRGGTQGQEARLQERSVT